MLRTSGLDSIVVHRFIVTTLRILNLDSIVVHEFILISTSIFLVPYFWYLKKSQNRSHFGTHTSCKKELQIWHNVKLQIWHYVNASTLASGYNCYWRRHTNSLGNYKFISLQQFAQQCRFDIQHPLQKRFVRKVPQASLFPRSSLEYLCGKSYVCNRKLIISNMNLGNSPFYIKGWSGRKRFPIKHICSKYYGRH